MRLGRKTNSLSCEYEMQEYFMLWARNKHLKCADEVLVSEVHRRADFLLLRSKKGLINVEAKCHDFDCMLKQLSDHAVYCDYSFAFLPDFSHTPKWFKENLAAKGFGLIVWNHKEKVITEVFEAHHNRPQNRNLRLKIMTIVKQKSDGRL